MSVTIHVGDLFSSRAQTLVNTVNCVGVMGKGIALEFKKRFPEMYEDYAHRCAKGSVRLGEPYIFVESSGERILNFPTKEHWRSVSRLTDIVQGLEYLEDHYREWGITSIAVPPLGCGLGGLEWRVVGPTLYRHLSRLTIPVYLFAPIGTPEAEREIAFLENQSLFSDAPTTNPGESRIDPAWVALVAILARIAQEPYHRPVGRVTFQKIAYFATAAGLPTNLEFVRSSYGPYSDALKPIITRLVNNGLVIEQSQGNMLEVKPGPTFYDAARRFDEQLVDWQLILNQVADLFLRADSQQAEIAAAVHFVATQSDSQSLTEIDILEGVQSWKQRRKPAIKEADIASSVRHLNLLGWIKARPSLSLPLPAYEK